MSPFPDGRLNVLAFHLLESLDVREDGVVGTTSQAMDSQEDFDVRVSELVVVRRVEGPRHTGSAGSQSPRPSAGGPSC